MTIEDGWLGIETWLERNAPLTYASLPGPATGESIRAMHAGFGRPIPGELAASLARHDGSGELFILPAAHRLSSARQITEECARNRALESSRRQHVEQRHPERPNQLPLRPPGEFYLWDSAWLPIAHDESGNGLFLDGPRGVIGTMDRDSGASFSEHAAFGSLAALLGHVAGALQTGFLDVWGGWEPYVDEDGYLDWRQD
jgi:cell wall assembly regulator SMI1